MSKIFRVLIFLIIIAPFSSCKFDLFEKNEFNIPEVSIDNIEQNFDTTFLDVTVNSNDDFIELIGMSYKKNEIPVVTNNQTLFEGGVGQFRVPIIDLDPENEYFFKAFAGNGYSYGESEPQSFNVPLRTPIVPCELNENRIIFNGLDQTINSISFDHDNDDYTISASSSNMSIRLEFTSPPTSAIYTTATDFLGSDNNSNRKVSIDITSWQWYIIADYGKVYVEKKGENQYNISFCDLESQANNGLPLKGNIQLD